MITTLIVIGSILAVILGIRFVYRSAKRANMETWKVGDRVTLIDPQLDYKLKTSGEQYALLVAWSMKEVIIDICGKLYSTTWSNIGNNIDADGRAIKERCQAHMKNDNVSFKPIQNRKSENAFGKDIAIMNETELNISLKDALTNENYELADKIKKQLERFR